jgi:Domain of unknown function (DUF397)
MNSSNPLSSPDFSWRTAKKCDGGACVRVGFTGKMIVVGDSKNPGGPVLFYTDAAWQEFVKGAKNGAFDKLA